MWVAQADTEAQGQTPRVDPDLAGAGGGPQLIRKVEADAGGKLAGALELCFQLIPEISSKGGTIHVESVAGVIADHGSSGCFPNLPHVGRGRQIAHQITTRRKGTGEILHLLPGSTTDTPLCFIALDTDFKGVLGLGHTSPTLPHP